MKAWILTALLFATLPLAGAVKSAAVKPAAAKNDA